MNGHRLAAVLRIRNLQERTARGLLGSSRHTHRRAETAERQTWHALDERRVCATPAGSATIMSTQMLVESGMLAAATQHGETLDAAEAVVIASSEWTIAARRVEGLERLVQRQDQVQREDLDRKASNEVDDLVLIKFAGQAS